jgi:hypothetical protein
MSVLAPTVPAMFPHPWRLLASLTHIDLVWHDGGDMGETDHEAGTISLRRGMTWAERRSTVIHECLHVLRGPSLDTLEEREELRVEKESARWLLPDVRVIGEAMAWAHNRAEAADELHVDERTLAIRLRYLHPSERGYLRERLEHH